MKTLLALVITVALITIVGSGYAGTVSGINIVSESHTMDLGFPDYAGVTHLTQSSLIDYGYSDEYYNVSAHIGDLRLQGLVTSPNVKPPSRVSEITFQSTYYFMPYVPEIQIKLIGGPGGDGFQVQLVDTVSSQNILNADFQHNPFPANLTLDTTRMYRFYLIVDNTGTYTGSLGAMLDLSITPEPATIALLALGGMMIRKLKNKSKR